MKPIEIKFNSGINLTFNHFDGHDVDKTYGVNIYQNTKSGWKSLDTGFIQFSPGTFYTLFKRFFAEIKVELIESDSNFDIKIIHTEISDFFNKNVLFILDTDNKHELFCWIEECIRFCEKWKCIGFIKSGNNSIERASQIYKNINFNSENIEFYATYSIGRYSIKESYDLFGMKMRDTGFIVDNSIIRYRSFNQPRDHKYLHSRDIICDILDLESEVGFRQKWIDADWFININQKLN